MNFDDKMRVLFQCYINHNKQILEMKGTPSMKINKLSPFQTDFDLLFELTQITSRNQGILKCRIVDDTGIINATFDSHTDKLEAGVVYHMTHLKTELTHGSLQILMSKDTSTTKEADTLGFKDKSNDISKKKFETSANSSKGTSISTAPVLDDAPKKQETLIPFTKQQAQQQLKLKRHFQKQMRGNRRVTDFKPRQNGEDKQKNFSNTHKFRPKQNGNNNKYIDKGQQQGESEGKLKYKQKPVQYQEKPKREYREKEENKRERNNKANSLVYRQKQ